jgi:Bacterial Ig-like domain (group 2)
MSSATPLTTLTVFAGWVVCIFVLLLGLAIIVLIAKGKINLSKLVSESNGDASMSRFQLLVFTFVVALSFFLVVAASQKLPDIPGTVLSLIGISASSYLVSKGIQTGAENRTISISPSMATVGPGQTQQFKVSVSTDGENKVVWSIQAGTGTITQDGLYKAADRADTAAAGAAAAGAGATAAATPPRAYATIKATSVDDPSLVDLAVVTLT